MLSRVALASLLVAGAAHADTPVDSISTPSSQPASSIEHRVDGVIGTGGAGARYTLLGEHLILDLQASGERDRQAAIARFGLARVESFGIEHDFVAGVGLVRASTEEPLRAEPMETHSIYSGRRRGQHRFLGAYINDTVRFIRGLDITAGLVVEQWKNLGGDSTITYGSGPPMDVDTPDVSYLFAPTVSVTGQLSDTLALTAQTFRGVHEVGPDVSAGRFSARARVFDAPDLGSGVATEASVQPIAPLVATVGYVRTSLITRASTMLTLREPRIVTLTTRVDTDRHLDALAVRRIRGGLSAFIGVDNLLDRRAADASGRLIHAGVRGTFAMR